MLFSSVGISYNPELKPVEKLGDLGTSALAKKLALTINRPKQAILEEWEILGHHDQALREIRGRRG